MRIPSVGTVGTAVRKTLVNAECALRELVGQEDGTEPSPFSQKEKTSHRAGFFWAVELIREQESKPHFTNFTLLKVGNRHKSFPASYCPKK